MNPQQRNVVLICVLLIAAGFMLNHLVLGPRYQTALVARDSLQAEVTAKEQRLANIKAIRTSLPKLEAGIGQIDTIGLPKNEEIPDLIELVEQAVLSQSDMQLITFAPSLVNAKTAGDSGYVETTYTLSVKGQANKLASFIDILHNAIRPMYVKSITLAPEKDEPAGVVVASLNMTTFSIKGHTAADDTAGKVQ